MSPDLLQLSIANRASKDNFPMILNLEKYIKLAVISVMGVLDTLTYLVSVIVHLLKYFSNMNAYICPEIL